MSGPRNIVPITTSPIPQILGPALQYHGGDVIGSVQVQPIFWGQAWQSNANSQLITQINSFFDRILQSTLMDMLGEYSTPSTRIQRGSRLPSVTITPPTTADPPATIADTQIQTTLQNWIAPPNAVPAPTANTLYFIYLPPGTTVTVVFNKTTFTSCAATNSICGYHSSIPSTKIFYAVIPLDMSSCAACKIYGGRVYNTRRSRIFAARVGVQ